MDKFTDTTLLHMHFLFNCHFDRVAQLLSVTKQKKKKMGYFLEGSVSNTIPTTHIFDIVK